MFLDLDRGSRIYSSGKPTHPKISALASNDNKTVCRTSSSTILVVTNSLVSTTAWTSPPSNPIQTQSAPPVVGGSQATELSPTACFAPFCSTYLKPSLRRTKRLCASRQKCSQKTGERLIVNSFSMLFLLLVVGGTSLCGAVTRVEVVKSWSAVVTEVSKTSIFSLPA